MLEPDVYDIILLAAGVLVLVSALLPRLLEKRLITAPIFYLLISVIAFGFFIDIPISHIAEDPYWPKRITELGVIISLTAVGLKINRPFAKETWSISSRLLIITMPVTIALMALMGWWFLGFIPATAVLLGAVIAPTDPVLADQVQTTPPGEEDELATRVALTTEAGLNDGFAFPFTNMAIAMAFAGAAPAGWFMDWFMIDFIYKVAMGGFIGFAMGWLLSKLLYSSTIFNLPKPCIGIISISLTLVPYGAAELLNSYGFIAVFVAACTFRQQEVEHEYLPILHDFSKELEQILVLIVFVLLGIYLTGGFVQDFRWYMIPVALVAIFVIRPVSSMVAIADIDLPIKNKLAVSFFGIRGVGSVYYLMYAVYHAEFQGARELIASVTVIIILSVLIHGLLAGPAMEWLEKD